MTTPLAKPGDIAKNESGERGLVTRILTVRAPDGRTVHFEYRGLSVEPDRCGKPWASLVTVVIGNIADALARLEGDAGKGGAK